MASEMLPQTALSQSGEPAADRDLLERVGDAIADLPNGERAQLRRLPLTDSLKARGIVLRALLRANVRLPRQPAALAPWLLLAHCAAQLAGTGERGKPPHTRDTSLGAALRNAGLSENRLLRLTSVRGDMLDAQVIKAFRLLANARSGPVNLWTLRDLIWSDESKADAARVRIAHDYYSAPEPAEKGISDDA